MKIGIFHGSFDPPHMGHLFAAVHALKTLKLDEVWIVPVYKHPFNKILSSYDHRVMMVCNVFSGLGNIKVDLSDEIKKTGHCIDLLKTLHEYPRNAGNEYVMLGGSDVSSNDNKHKDKEEILKLCTVAPRIPRGSYSEDKYAIPNYSSSEIRQLVKDGKSINGLTTDLVVDYILEKRLYKE